MTIVGIRKCLVFSIRSSWSLVCQHPFVAALLLFMLFLHMYFPSSFAFIVYSSPVIACTALLLGALLVYGEADVHETEDLDSVNAFVKVSEKEERSKDFAFLKKGEGHISEKDVYNGGAMSSTKVGPFNGDGDGKDGMDLVASFSSKIAEKEIQTEKTVINAVAARDLEFVEKEVFSIENSADSAPQTAEGLKVEIEKRLDSQFDSSLGSPWQKVNTHAVSSGSESDESEESDGDESLSSDTSTTDVVPLIDELHPLLESENPQPVHRSIDTSDTASRASSPEREFYDDDSAEEETENQGDGEDEEAQEKDNDEAVVKWTADDQKNLMDLGSSELERNQRLENLIAKRRAKKLQRFQTDKNLIDLDTEPLPFMEEISRLNVQVPAISTSRSNPFDLPFDSVETFGLLPVPGSAPSVLLPRRNPFDLPYDQNEESSKLTGESSRPYDGSIFSQREPLPRRINNLNLGTVSNAVDRGKNEAKLKPYFVPEKITGTNFASFESQLSEESDSDESTASESDSASAVFNQDYELSKHETHERLLSLNQDVGSVEGESDLSVEVGSSILEQDHIGADSVELEIGEVGSSSPVSSTANLEVIDERYGGSNSSSYSEEDDKCIETSINLDSLKSFAPMQAVVKPGPPDKEGGLTHDSQVAEPSLSGERDEEADDSQAADPVYDSSPSAKSTSHIPSLEVLFSNVKGKAGFSAESSSASDTKANLQEVFSTLEEGDSMLVRESMPSVLHNYIYGVESDQKNVVEKKSNGLNEVSDEVDTNRRQSSVDEGSDFGINVAENVLSDGEIHASQPKPSKQLDSRMANSNAEEQDELHQNQFPVSRSDDAGISVNQQYNLNGSHDHYSAMEQPLILESDDGSSSPFDVDLEMKDAEVHIPSQQNIVSSTSDSADGSSEATGNSPISLNFKVKLGDTELI